MLDIDIAFYKNNENANKVFYLFVINFVKKSLCNKIKLTQI